jgi:hypothetical protein
MAQKAFTPQQVKEIRKMAANGMTHRKIAEHFGRTSANDSRLVMNVLSTQYGKRKLTKVGESKPIIH